MKIRDEKEPIYVFCKVNITFAANLKITSFMSPIHHHEPPLSYLCEYVIEHHFRRITMYYVF